MSTEAPVEVSTDERVPNVFLYYVSSIVVIKTPLALLLFVISQEFGLPNSWWMIIPCFLIAILFNMLYDNLLIEMTTYVVGHEFKKKIAEELSKIQNPEGNSNE
jgi:hypothetical protein